MALRKGAIRGAGERLEGGNQSGALLWKSLVAAFAPMHDSQAHWDGMRRRGRLGWQEWSTIKRYQ